MDKRFVHLHLHTDYSLLDAAIQIKPLAGKLVNLGMDACAITDHGNMYGAISFYNEMRDHQIKPIIGCEVYITRSSRFEKTAPIAGEKVNHHLILLARDLEGYHNLVRLTSRAFTEGFYYKPRIDLELLSAHSKGLIGLSACISGIPSYLLSRGKEEEAATVANQFQDIFGKGNYFLEIQDHGLEIQQRIRKSLVALSKSSGIPLVATNDCHYLDPDDARAHDILLCIGTGKTINDPNRLQYGSPYFYVRSGAEMWELFGSELPDALSRTVEIAEMCQLELPKNANHLPVFLVPSEEGLSVDAYFEKQVKLGFERRKAAVWESLLAQGKLKCSLSDYNERLQWEVRMIKQMGYSSYFLIVWDFIKYAKERSIPVGPGRGSAAGSLVAYCLEITDIDPLEYDLFFERFLNPERVSMPDIDIDFCVRGRADVLNHVTDLYGRDAVCQIITFGTMASRAAIKDVGRALDMPYGEVERIAKLIPPPVRGRNVGITQALEQTSELRVLIENDPRIKDLIELAQRLEGCARHTSVHAAGVVISPKPLEDLIPVAVSSHSELTTQYEMVDLEKTGMLKMDFLGLTTLTVINDCLNHIKQHLKTDVDWAGLSLDDSRTMELFAKGRTEAVFQFESRGMQEICKRLKPKNLEDLAALNALYRPGPLDGGM
ncbi:MAG: DNA polymerase III subunit alpha, partial [Pyrinomonadaceae bacterium]